MEIDTDHPINPAYVQKWIGENRVRLAWSNPSPPPDLMVRLALLEGNTFVMADAFAIFGLDYLEARWDECLTTPEGVAMNDRIQSFFNSCRIALEDEKSKDTA